MDSYFTILKENSQEQGQPGQVTSASPIANLYRAKDNYNNYLRTFGDMFVEATIIPDLKFKSNFGLDNGRSYYYNMTKRAAGAG